MSFFLIPEQLRYSGVLHEFACNPWAGAMLNHLCTVPILVYMLLKQAQELCLANDITIIDVDNNFNEIS